MTSKTSTKLKLLLGLWNGPAMMGSYYARYLESIAEVWTVGPEMNTKSDFAVQPGDPLQPVLDKMDMKVDFYLQFYSKPDYFPPDLFKIDIPKAWYVYDTHIHFEELSTTAYLFDFIFCTDKETKEKLHRVGIPRVEVLSFAADPEYYYRPYEKMKRKYKVGFAGSAWGSPQLKEREMILKRLEKNFDLKIEHRTLIGPQVADFYQNCDIVFNHAIQDDINMRVSEALLSGRPLLTSMVTGLERYVTPGVHVEVYKDINDAEAKLKSLLEEPERAEEMAKNGQEKAMKEHTYEIRANQIVQALKKELLWLKEKGSVQKNPWLLKATQFRYHYFRFPGDSLKWLYVNLKNEKGGINKIISLLLKALIFILRIYEKMKKVELFQKPNS